MKRGFSILIVAMLLVSLGSTALASRLQQVSYSSGFQVANLSATDMATIKITYYPQSGDAVEVGDKLISFEAMKMETTLLAEVAGTLADCSWQVGDQISEGDLLFHVAEEDA